MILNSLIIDAIKKKSELCFDKEKTIISYAIKYFHQQIEPLALIPLSG